MKKPILILLFLFLLVLGLVLGAGTTQAQTPAFTLSRSVIGSGGMGGSEGGYTIHSTLGQPVAGSVASEDYELGSGFWGRALMAWFNNFLPLILR